MRSQIISCHYDRLDAVDTYDVLSFGKPRECCKIQGSHYYVLDSHSHGHIIFNFTAAKTFHSFRGLCQC